ATAQPFNRPAMDFSAGQPRYHLAGGVWEGDQVDSQGRRIVLGFREDGGCIMVVGDGSTGRTLGKSTGRFTLVFNRLTLRLSVAEVRGTLTWLGSDAIRIVDAKGDVKTFKRVRPG